jgi:hypothetical protein
MGHVELQVMKNVHRIFVGKSEVVESKAYMGG